MTNGKTKHRGHSSCRSATRCPFNGDHPDHPTRATTPLKILVAGGAGFLGSHLVGLLLAQGRSVVVLDSFVTASPANLLPYRGHHDLRIARRDVREAPHGAYERVYHLASPASPEDYGRLPIETLMTNAVGTARLLEIAHRARARFLLASTSEVYGDPLVHPQHERYFGNVDPVGPRSSYDEGKRFAEALTMAYVRARGLDARIIRIFNAYGPRMRPGDGRMPSSFIVHALREEPIPVQGSGRQTRSLCYVVDIAEGLLAAMERGKPGEVYNIGRPDEMRVIDFARLVRRVTGSHSPIVRVPGRPGDIRQRRPSVTKARRELGWRPRTTLRTGLRQTVDWYRQELGERLIIRCLHVIDTLGRGGAEQGLVNLLEPLRSQGIDSEVAVLFDLTTLAPVIRSAGFTVHLLRLPWQWDARAIPRIASLCRSGSFDIVQAHLTMSTLYVGLSRILAPRPRRVTLFLNLSFDVHPPRTARQRARKWLEGVVNRTMIDAHVAVSEDTARHYERHLGLRQVAVIPLSVPAVSVAGATRTMGRRDAAGRFTTLTPARFVHQKGHRFLVEALRLLRDRGLDAAAIFVGDGPLFGEISAQVKALGMDDRIELRPAARHEDVLATLAEVDAVVLPSLQEGLPVAALEAMAAGKTLVATAVSGLRELVLPRLTGVLVPPGDPSALADAIQSIMEDDIARQRMGSAAAARVRDQYTSEAVARRWAALYRRLAAGASSRTDGVEGPPS